MPTKIRLQRFGKKGKPFYHIVIADSRAPRDGRKTENIGTYDPISNPAVIELNFERALHWVQVGAEPTDTVRAILSYKGVLYKHHLLKGVTKGALTEEQVEVKFNEWLKDKESRIGAKKSNLATSARDLKKERLAAEAKVNEARVAEFNKRIADEQEAARAALAPVEEAETSEETTEESAE
ncbi:MAG TPA: 30S ribosomal protein S16 [Bacteroidales bacterium]|nr:30S ribosomal protein S16 [Bacteroidales bacterium]